MNAMRDRLDAEFHTAMVDIYERRSARLAMSPRDSSSSWRTREAWKLRVSSSHRLDRRMGSPPCGRRGGST